MSLRRAVRNQQRRFAPNPPHAKRSHGILVNLSSNTRRQQRKHRDARVAIGFRCDSWRSISVPRPRLPGPAPRAQHYAPRITSLLPSAMPSEQRSGCAPRRRTPWRSRLGARRVADRAALGSAASSLVIPGLAASGPGAGYQRFPRIDTSADAPPIVIHRSLGGARRVGGAMRAMRALALVGCALVLVPACFFDPHFGPGRS
jgi:hypothetical protein